MTVVSAHIILSCLENQKIDGIHDRRIPTDVSRAYNLEAEERTLILAIRVLFPAIMFNYPRCNEIV